MSSSIHIGSVRIPFDDYVTQGTAILGIRGAGKTYTAKGIAEQMLEAKVPIIVFDAIGVWRFLKIAGDGNSGKAFKLVVAGGEQPDLPLTPESTPQIIRAALRENIPLVVDLYDPKLSKADWRRIVEQAFRIILYENKGLRHIFLEEAAEYVPQQIRETKGGNTFAEVEKLVRMGGNASVGITMINQRSQELNKSVLELCDNLVMMRQKGFNAIAYAEKWADRLSPDTAEQIGQKLPKMAAGECWVFTDANEEPVFTRSGQIKSFHPDRKRPNHPKNAQIADTEEFVQKMAGELQALIEESKVNDPAELKRTISDLKRKLAQAEQNQPESKRPTLDPKLKQEIKNLNKAMEMAMKFILEITTRNFPEAVSTDEIKAAVQAAVDRALPQIQTRVDARNNEMKRLREQAEKLITTLNSIRKSEVVAIEVSHNQPFSVATPRPSNAAPVIHRGSPDTNGSLDGAQQKIIDTVAILKIRGLTPNREMIAAWMDIHPNGGRYGSNLALLRENEYLSGCQPTDKGARAAQNVTTGPDAAREVLDGARRAIFDLIKDGQTHSRESLAEALGIHPNGGRYGSNLARLRTMGLIPERGEIKLTEAAYL